MNPVGKVEDPDMPFITIASYRHRHEAEFAKAVLEAAGIDSGIFADDAGGMHPWLAVYPVRLMVDAQHADAARAVLEPTPGTSTSTS